MNQVYPQVWMSLSKPMREHLAKVFGLSRSGVTEVRDQELISDGHTVEDLLKITLLRREEYVGPAGSFSKAWDLSVSKANFELNPPIGVLVGEGQIDPVPAPVMTPPADDLFDSGPAGTPPPDKPRDPTVVLSGNPEDEGKTIEIKGKFCDTCDSKGGRHKKTCPKYEPLILSTKKSNDSKNEGSETAPE